MLKGIDHATCPKARVVKTTLMFLALASTAIGQAATAPTTRPTSRPTSRPIETPTLPFDALVHRMPLNLRPPAGDHWTQAEHRAALEWFAKQLAETNLIAEVPVAGHTRHNADDRQMSAHFSTRAFGVLFSVQVKGDWTDSALRALRNLDGKGTAQATFSGARTGISTSSSEILIVYVSYDAVDLKSIRPERKEP